MQLETEYLSGQSLQELLNFVHYLKFKEGQGTWLPLDADLATDLDPQDDPILQLIGIADVDPFAEDIDKILYDSV